MPAPLLIFLLLDFVVAVAYAVCWSVGGVPWGLTALVDPKGGASIVVWYSSAQLFLLAVATAVLAYDALDRRARTSWFLPALPAAFAGLSFDALAHVHDLLRSRSYRLLLLLLGSNTPVYYTRLWTVVVGLPALLAMVGLVTCLGGHLSAGVRLKYVIGLVVFASSALVIDVDFIPSNSFVYVLSVSTEEFGKMVGVTIMLWATYEALLSRGLGFTSGAPPGAADGPPLRTVARRTAARS